MKRVRAALFAAALLGSCAAPELPDPRSMSFPPLHFSPPAPQRFERDNGAVLFLLPDREVPLVNVRVLVRAGSLLDSPGKTGLAEITARVMRSGGTENFTPDELNSLLERRGAVLETFAGHERSGATLSVLSGDLAEGISLLAEVLRRPAFGAGEVEREKRRKVELLGRENDKADSIAFREFRKLLYRGDPRGRVPTVEEVEGFVPEDLSAFHGSNFFPDRLVAGASGDFTEAEFLALWDRHFGDWEVAPGPLPERTLPRSSAPAGVYFASREFPQVTLVTGHLAPSLESPSYHAFTVLNYILGGAGFNSRLTEEIRSNRGLAYSVGSSYRARPGYGVFFAYCATAPETAGEVALLMRSVSAKIAREGVSAEELAWAKESILNNLIFSVDRTEEVVSRQVGYEMDGLPPDFLEKYRLGIGGVTAGDVAEAARCCLRPAEAVTVVVGAAEGLEQSLAPLGAVHPLELTEH